MYVDARRTNKERIRFLASDLTFCKNLNLVKNIVKIFFYFAQKVGACVWRGGGGGGGGHGSPGPTHFACPAMTKFAHSFFSKHDKKHPGRLITTQTKNTWQCIFIIFDFLRLFYCLSMGQH